MKNSLIYTAFFISGFLFAIPNLQVDGFTMLGSDAPAIKMKKITGTTAASEGTATWVSHGIDASKILGILVSVNYLGSRYVVHQYDNGDNTGYVFSSDWNETYVIVTTHETNSENILSKPWVALVIYEE